MSLNSSTVVKNISASIIVFLVALPLCLGIALASKTPEFSGIIAGVVGGIVIGLISGSPLSVSGPAAGLSGLVAGIMVSTNNFQSLLLSVAIAGAIQLIFAVIRFGVIADFIPNSVIKGMLAAIGLILILKQFQHLIGYDKDYEGDEAFIQFDHNNTFTALIESINGITPIATLIGLLSLGILILYEQNFIKKYKGTQLISGPLMVVLLGICISKLFINSSAWQLEAEHYVSIPVASSFKEFTTFFTLPDFALIIDKVVWINALKIAIVASLETLLGISAVDKLDPYNRTTPINRELFAQGTGNMVSGLLGGLPLTSVIVRSSANVNAGATNKSSAIFHSILLLLAAFFIPQLLNTIPKASLAAILIFTGYKLIKPSVIKHYYKLGWNQFIPFVITILVILFTDLLIGVLVGTIVGVVFVIYSSMVNSIQVVNNHTNYLIKFRNDAYFFLKPILKKQLQKIPAESQLLVDLSDMHYVDRDIKDTLIEFGNEAELKSIEFDVVMPPKQSLDK
jgi:MFS superfamily sulfate permease-like transporter